MRYAFLNPATQMWVAMLGDPEHPGRHRPAFLNRRRSRVSYTTYAEAELALPAIQAVLAQPMIIVPVAELAPPGRPPWHVDWMDMHGGNHQSQCEGPAAESIQSCADHEAALTACQTAVARLLDVLSVRYAVGAHGTQTFESWVGEGAAQTVRSARAAITAAGLKRDRGTTP